MKELTAAIADKYIVSEEMVKKLFENNEELRKKFSDKIDTITSETYTKKDDKIQELLLSNLSRMEGNGIFITMWHKVDEHYCTIYGARSIKNVVEDIVYRVKKAGLSPDEYLLESSSIDSQYEDVITGSYSFFVDVDYGGNEGIYFDLYLKHTFNKEKKTVNLLTGKTLYTDAMSFAKMSYIATFINLLVKNDSYEIKDLGKFMELKKNFDSKIKYAYARLLPEAGQTTLG